LVEGNTSAKACCGPRLGGGKEKAWVFVTHGQGASKKEKRTIPLSYKRGGTEGVGVELDVGKSTSPTDTAGGSYKPNWGETISGKRVTGRRVEGIV